MQKGSHQRSTKPDLLIDDFKSSLNNGLPASSGIFPAFNALQAMDIVLRLESALSGTNTIVGLCIQNACIKKQPALQIIAQVKDMITDNYNAMADMIGIKLCDTIKNFK